MPTASLALTLPLAAVLLVVGYRLLKRTARFALHVDMVLALLACAELLGWIRW